MFTVSKGKCVHITVRHRPLVIMNAGHPDPKTHTQTLQYFEQLPKSHTDHRVKHYFTTIFENK